MIGKKLGIVGIILAVIGALLKSRPSLVFQVPLVGWFLGFLSGYGLPPFFEIEAFSRCYAEANCPWLQPGDVVVASCSKCGTNWMLTIVHELRTWNQPDLRDFRDILDITPWPDLRTYPSEDREHPEDGWGLVWNNSQLPFKVFKSHVAPFKTESDGVRYLQMPVRERRDVKYLVVSRNAADAMFSFTKFIPKLTNEWRSIWGDIPVVSPTIESLIKGYEGSPYGSPIHFFRDWIQFAGESNVLMMHYSEIMKDTKKHLKIIAKFIGVVGIPEKEYDAIAERVSVEYMKARGHRYKYLVGPTKSISILDDKAIIGKGVFAKNVGVTEQEKEIVDTYGESILGSEKYSMLDKGFDVILNKET